MSNKNKLRQFSTAPKRVTRAELDALGAQIATVDKNVKALMVATKNAIGETQERVKAVATLAQKLDSIVGNMVNGIVTHGVLTPRQMNLNGGGSGLVGPGGAPVASKPRAAPEEGKPAAGGSDAAPVG